MKSLTLIVDLSGADDVRGVSIARELLDTAPQGVDQHVFIVEDNGVLATEFGRSAATLVTVGPQTRDVERWSAAVQVVTGGFVVLLTDPFAWRDTLEDPEVMGGCEATLVYSPDPAVEPVVRALAFAADSYAAVRGFNLRLADGPACAADFIRRIDLVTGQPTRTLGPTPPPAIDPPSDEIGLVANLPAWRFRPLALDPLVTVVVVVDDVEVEPDSLSSIRAQTFDDQEIVVLDFTQSQEVRDWVSRNTSEKLRMGARDEIRYIPLADDEAALDSALKRLRGRYLLFANGHDLLLPWAVETALSHMQDSKSGIAGRRVHFNAKDGRIAPRSSGWRNSVLLASKRDALACIQQSSGPCARRVSWPTFQARLTGISGVHVAFALSSHAEESPPKSVVWLTPDGKRSPTQALRPYLPDRLVTRYAVFTSYTVGKIDEIGAYDRIVATVTSYDERGNGESEVSLIQPLPYSDMARLARVSIRYVAHAQETPADASAFAWSTLTRLLKRRLKHVEPQGSLRVSRVAAIVSQADDDDASIAGWVSFRLLDRPPLILALQLDQRPTWEQETPPGPSCVYVTRQSVRSAQRK